MLEKKKGLKSDLKSNQSHHIKKLKKSQLNLKQAERMKYYKYRNN